MKSGTKNHRPERNKRGDSLLEVLMAVFILALGSGVATNLIVNSTQSNIFSRNNLLALNLAVEGIEAVRNIRDNNWLKFSYDKENCWNMRPEQPAGSDCKEVTNLMAEGNYTIDLNPLNMGWTLTQNTTNPLKIQTGVTVSNNDRNYLLNYISMDGSPNRDLMVSANTIASIVSPVTDNGSSLFYRMVSIDYMGAITPDGAESMLVKCLVQWKEGSLARRIQISSILTNYNKIKVSP